MDQAGSTSSEMSWRALGVLSIRNYPAMEFFCKQHWISTNIPLPESSSLGAFSSLFPICSQSPEFGPGLASSRIHLRADMNDFPSLSPSLQGAAGQDAFKLSPICHPKSMVSPVTLVPRRSSGPTVSLSPVKS